MSATELDQLLERMPAIAEAVQRFKSDAIQVQVFDALVGAFQSAAHAPTSDSKKTKTPEPPADGKGDTGGDPASAQGARRTASRKVGTGTAKSKQSFSIDKTLDLHAGSQNFKDFAVAKQPKNVMEKALVAVYWLTRVLDSADAATLDRVYTCFKHMAWPIPSDLANTTQQAGAKGWLDSRKRDDLRVVVGGENHIEHEMPAEAKS